MKSENKCHITIFTPTYNRAHTLERCYDSIIKQKSVELEWLIVDDGSTDNTKEVVEGFIQQGLLDIRYYHRENEGKQSCWNYALDKAKGEYFIGVDSDDALLPNTLCKIMDSWHKYDIDSQEKIIGIRAPSVDFNMNQIGKGLIKKSHEKLSWYKEFSSIYHGERIDIFKTDIIRKFKYPVSKGIKFIPEIWLYSQLSKCYSFLYVDFPLRVFFDQETNNRLSRSAIKNHADGQFLARSSLINNAPFYVWLKRPDQFLKTIIRLAQLIKYTGKDSVNKVNNPFRQIIILLGRFL